jgi:hypothetical protein
MKNSMIASREEQEITVGDRVWILHSVFAGESEVITAEVIDTRRVLGGQTYLIKTEMGEQKLVGANQISQVEPSTK